MEKYTQYFNEEENSLSELTDTSLPQKFVDFIKNNPFPKDHSSIHSFAEGLGIEAEILEQYAYTFLTLMFKGGKSKGEEIEASKEAIDIGDKIELEHFDYDIDNNVVKEMIKILASKVRNDHNAEDKEYYLKSVNFKDELKKENK